MSRRVSVEHFCAAEVKRRLNECKRYLQRYRNQRALFLAPTNVLDLVVVDVENYDCYDEYNYVSSFDLSEQLIRDCVKCNRALFVDDSLFKSFNVIDYVDRYFVALQRYFSLTSFCLLDKNDDVFIKCIVCLGSLHHAPRVFYRDCRFKFYFDKVAEYNDLF